FGFVIKFREQQFQFPQTSLKDLNEIPTKISSDFYTSQNHRLLNYEHNIYLCKQIGLILADKCDSLIEITRKISAMLYNLIEARYKKFSCSSGFPVVFSALRPPFFRSACFPGYRPALSCYVRLGNNFSAAIF